MIGAALTVALLVAAILGPALFASLQRPRRREPEWWPAFERQFRDYVAQRQGSDRHRTGWGRDSSPGRWAG